MLVVDIEKILIPSINNKYSLNTKTKRLFLNPKYRDFKKLISETCHKTNIDNDWSCKIQMQSYVDIDNPIKPILDGIAIANLINDKNCLDLHILKEKNKRGKEGYLKVWIDAM